MDWWKELRGGEGSGDNSNRWGMIGRGNRALQMMEKKVEYGSS